MSGASPGTWGNQEKLATDASQMLHAVDNALKDLANKQTAMASKELLHHGMAEAQNNIDRAAADLKTFAGLVKADFMQTKNDICEILRDHATTHAGLKDQADRLQSDQTQTKADVDEKMFASTLNVDDWAKDCEWWKQQWNSWKWDAPPSST